jgi:hypothetical protein
MKGAAMQKWEYKFVECISHFDEWYPAFEDGEEIKNWKTGNDVTVFSNALGEQGWEMVTSNFSAVGSESEYREFFRLVFKRPKG